jgi:hypothetical protein
LRTVSRILLFFCHDWVLRKGLRRFFPVQALNLAVMVCRESAKLRELLGKRDFVGILRQCVNKRRVRRGSTSRV